MTEETKTQEFETRIRNAVEPMGEVRPDSYDACGDAIAKAFVLVAETDPSLLVSDEKGHANKKLFAAVEARWPGFFKWLNATNFMAGWAANAARRILKAEG